jgi:hypothetical protein
MTEKSPHRSFTVRIPIELYCEIGEQARADGVSINHKVGQFIRLGMGESINMNDKIMELIKNKLLPEINKEDSQ